MKQFQCPKCPYVSKPQLDGVNEMTHVCRSNDNKITVLKLIK